MLRYAIPLAYLLLGLALRLRIAWLRGRGRDGGTLLGVASGFAAVVGVFLLAVTVMSGR